MLVDWISKLVFPTVNKVSKHYLSLCSASDIPTNFYLSVT